MTSRTEEYRKRCNIGIKSIYASDYSFKSLE